jgi:Cell morphogenesis N-terminal
MLDGSMPKDSDLRLEVLVKGTKYLQLKVWPPESFEEGADFLDRFALCFANAHGRLKPAFAESLVQLLHPIAEVR